MIVSRETSSRLLRYADLVIKWNTSINLVSPSTLADFRKRHIDDCHQLVQLARPHKEHWVDLGSGGGLPGIVVAILASETPIRVTLIESDKRKAAFLRTVIRELSLGNATVISDRIEEVPPLRADYVSARALAPLPVLLKMVVRHIAADGEAWLMKGRTWEQECSSAQKIWQFDFSSFPSRTDSEAAILRVTGVKHV